MQIRGSCHCGNIAFTLTWEPDPMEIPVRACDCTFCRKHGGLWTSTPQGALEVIIKDSAQVSAYEFGTSTAQFQVCARCGAVPLVTSRIDARLYAVVNVNVFEGIDPALLRAMPASFEGESVAGRLERRKSRWIANVSYRCV